ncbi:unnamed protein product [Coccothraustes coccothraustes]
MRADPGWGCGMGLREPAGASRIPGSRQAGTGSPDRCAEQPLPGVPRDGGTALGPPAAPTAERGRTSRMDAGCGPGGRRLRQQCPEPPGPGPQPASVPNGAAQPEPPGHIGGGQIPSGVGRIGRVNRQAGTVPFHAALSHRIRLIDE